MRTEQLVVIGAGGHAKMLIEAARPEWPAIVILDDNPALVGSRVLDCPIVGMTNELPEGEISTIVAIGDNHLRDRLLKRLCENERRVATIVHPAASISPSAHLDVGVFVGAGAVVGAEATLSRGVILNTSASVDHDCIVGECAHVAPGAHLCGQVIVGARTLLGAGSIITPGRQIGRDCRIGAGAVVIDDIGDEMTVAGVPARPIGKSRRH
jgi:UDP-perosamine 4-acetyltransferase